MMQITLPLAALAQPLARIVRNTLAKQSGGPAPIRSVDRVRRRAINGCEVILSDVTLFDDKPVRCVSGGLRSADFNGQGTNGAACRAARSSLSAAGGVEIPMLSPPDRYGRTQVIIRVCRC